MGYLLCGSSVVPEVVGDSPGAIHQHDTACHHVIIIIIIIDHLQSGVVNNFGRFCMSVRPSHDHFRKPQRKKSIFAHPVYLQAIRVKFVCKGHQVKVKVT